MKYVLILSTLFISSCAIAPVDDSMSLKIQGTIHLYTEKGSGTGFIVHEEQVEKDCVLGVVTAAHVADKGNIFSSSEYFEYAKIVHSTRDISLVWLRKEESCNSNEYSPVEIDYTNYPPGTFVYNVAFPVGTFYVGQGYLGIPESVPHILGWEHIYTISMFVRPGSSGSPVFKNNKVIGIVVGGHPIAQQIGLMLPIVFLKEIY